MYFKLALGNVKKSFRDYGIYFLTLVFGVCVFYAFNSIVEQQAVLDLGENQLRIMELFGALINGVSVFIAIVLGFLIVYASRYLIRRRKKEFGTYLTLGMPPAKVSRIIIYENLLVGLVSLAIGIALGIAVSQLLLYTSAAMFSITLDHFVFIFSAAAMIQTVIYFGVIFLITLLFNVVTITRYKLIDLINANRKNEGIKLRSLPLSVVLFIISLVLIGIAYYLLIDNGLVMLDAQFGLSTLFVCVGTVLFFFSLSGFLLRAIQSSKKLYFRGLNMFTLRQINSKINTTFISISIVSMALFLAITSTCGGAALASAFNADLEANTQFDVTMVAFFTGADKTATGPQEIEISGGDGETYIDEKIELARADNFDMQTALKRDISNWDALVKAAVQLDIYESDISFGDILVEGNIELTGLTEDMIAMSDEAPLDATSISEFNEQRVFLGLEPISLATDEYLIWCDFSVLQDYYLAYLKNTPGLEIYGATLKPASLELESMPMRTSAQASNSGTIVVPDEVLPANAPLTTSYLNLMYNGERADIEEQFLAALKSSYPERYEGIESVNTGWPWLTQTTAVEMIDQASGIKTTITYLAIYIGFVLLIACAAILSLQQLSEAADNVARYHLLEELGVDSRMSSRALFVQIAIYFLFPLVVAVCHSIVALNVVVEVAAAFGRLNIAVPLVMTVGVFLVLYGIYFLVTYFASRTMVQSKNV